MFNVAWCYKKGNPDEYDDQLLKSESGFFQRPVREASAVAGETTQVQDQGHEEDPQSGLRRGLHLLRDPL